MIGVYTDHHGPETKWRCLTYSSGESFMNRFCLSLIILWSIFGLSGEMVGADQTRIGKQIEEFSLRDYRGKVHSLNEYAESKILVVAFLGNDCPLAKLYAPRLESLAQELKDARRGPKAPESSRYRPRPNSPASVRDSFSERRRPDRIDSPWSVAASTKTYEQVGHKLGRSEISVLAEFVRVLEKGFPGPKEKYFRKPIFNIEHDLIRQSI